MNTQQVIDYFGSPRMVARALGIKAPSIYDWIETGMVPEIRQYQIEMASKGALRADKPALRVPFKKHKNILKG